LQASQVSNDGTRRVLAKRLANGDVAVALFNQGGSTTTVSTTASAIGKTGSSFTLRDAWTNATSTTTGAISASVPGHGTVVYRVSSATTPTTAGPTTAGPTTAGPTTAGPTTAGPTTAGPTTAGPTTAGPTTAGPGNGCTATITMNAWTGGFTAEVQIAGSNSSGWTVKLNLPSGVAVTGGWNANVSGSTGTVTFTNMSYNNRLPAGFGFQATGNGTVTVASCTAT
jgi:alpha-galactosidase